MCLFSGVNTGRGRRHCPGSNRRRKFYTYFSQQNNVKTWISSVSDHPKAFLLRSGEITSLFSCESSANLTFFRCFLNKNVHQLFDENPLSWNWVVGMLFESLKSLWKLWCNWGFSKMEHLIFHMSNWHPMAFSKFLLLFTLFLFQPKLFADFDPISQVVPFSVCLKIFQMI